MDEAKLLEEYTPYVRRAASWFMYDSIRSRIEYDDLLQEGLMTLVILHKAGRDTKPSIIKDAIRINMLCLVLKNYSQLHVTTHAFKKTTCEKTRALTTASLFCSIPLQDVLDAEEEGRSSALIAENDDTQLFVKEFMDSLSERERIICMALMNRMSEREISRRSGIPYITVRRTRARLKDKLAHAMRDPA